MNRNFESHSDIVGKNISLKSRDFSENYLMNAMGPGRYWNFAGKMANANVKNSLDFRNNVNAMAVDKYFNNPNVQDKLIDMDIKSYENTAKLVKNLNNQSAASANIDKILSDNEHIMRGKDLAHKAVTTGEGSKAIQDYEEILSKRTNPTTFKDKLDNFANSASYKTSQGLSSAKKAITEGFHGLSGKVQDITGLSSNAANIATGAGLGLAAAGLIGGGIALHKHLKKKKAAKKMMANMSERSGDFGLSGAFGQSWVSLVPIYGTHNTYKKDQALAKYKVMGRENVGLPSSRKNLRTLAWWDPTGVGTIYRGLTASSTGDKFQDLVDYKTKEYINDHPNESIHKSRKKVKKALYNGYELGAPIGKAAANSLMK